jgi:hypothetical protein
VGNRTGDSGVFGAKGGAGADFTGAPSAQGRHDRQIEEEMYELGCIDSG